MPRTTIIDLFLSAIAHHRVMSIRRGVPLSDSPDMSRFKRAAYGCATYTDVARVVEPMLASSQPEECKIMRGALDLLRNDAQRVGLV